jgi:IMP cyclohydrolase
MDLEDNFRSKILENSYPGRGLVMGKSESGLLLQLYWIMGRSENSRNRRFEVENGILKTVAADPEKMQDPSLVIYEVMLDWNDSFIVGNGDQTSTVYRSLHQGFSFDSALLSRDREPDGPNFTPRITGMIQLGGARPYYSFSILKAADGMSDFSDRHFFYKEVIPAGVGYMLTTYEGDGNPLPSFCGEPVAMPFQGSEIDIIEKYWEGLNEDNKISLALRSIDPETGESEITIKNRY